MPKKQQKKEEEVQVSLEQTRAKSKAEKRKDQSEKLREEAPTWWEADEPSIEEKLAYDYTQPAKQQAQGAASLLEKKQKPNATSDAKGPEKPRLAPERIKQWMKRYRAKKAKQVMFSEPGKKQAKSKRGKAQRRTVYANDPRTGKGHIEFEEVGTEMHPLGVAGRYAEVDRGIPVEALLAEEEREAELLELRQK